MNKLIVKALTGPVGEVSIRLCRRPCGNFEQDNAPLPLTYGTLDVELTLDEMAEIHEATGAALFARLVGRRNA